MVLQEACLSGRSEKRVVLSEGWEISGPVFRQGFYKHWGIKNA